MQTALKIIEKVFAVFKSNKLAFVSSLILLLSIAYVNAEEVADVEKVIDEQQCPGGYCVCKPDVLDFPASSGEPDGNGVFPISLEADNMDSVGKEVVILKGNAEMRQGRQSISADELRYYRETDQAEGKGNVVIRSENGDWFKSDEANVHAPTHVGEVSNVEYKLAQRLGGLRDNSNRDDNVAAGDDFILGDDAATSDTVSKDENSVNVAARGDASKAYLEGEGLIRLENVTYTSCQQGRDDVLINAKELELDQVAGFGTATKATVRFKNVPIFYVPKMTFPINDERKTGLLFPSIGSEQDSGFTLGLPWYWNIAPNQDATITPKLYADRGIQLGAEYRYLTKNSKGQFYGEVLPDDDEFIRDGVVTNETRSMVRFEHRQDIAENWQLNVNYNDVSDVEYFDDFSNDLYSFSSTFVPREASIRYSGQYWNVNTRLSDFQVVDDIEGIGSGPYERLPQISFNTYLPKINGIEYGISGEITNFSDDSRTRVDGTRVDLTPSISLPLENIWGFVTPKVSLRHTSYSLDAADPVVTIPTTTITDTDLTATEESTSVVFNDSPSRTTPIFSVDSGIALEKSVSWGGRSSIQTLEPRLFYVYIPDDDQDDLPNFGTGVTNLNNFNSIYRENRFSGADRVGDTNQITIGVTTRITDIETGEQRLKASLGQIYFLDDRTENLNPDEVLTDSSSDFLAEIRVDFNDRWNASSFAQWDTEDSEIRNFRLNLNYELDDRKKFALRYRYSEAERSLLDPTLPQRRVDQVTLEAEWPISDRWQFSASERYSLETSESLRTKVGLEYNACCWRFRIGAENRVTRDANNDRDAIFAELELTGLGSIRSGL